MNQNQLQNLGYQQQYSYVTPATTQYITTWPNFTIGEPPMSKYETAMKIVQKLIEEGILDAEALTVPKFLDLVTKLVEDVL